MKSGKLTNRLSDLQGKRNHACITMRQTSTRLSKYFMKPSVSTTYRVAPGLKSVNDGQGPTELSFLSSTIRRRVYSRYSFTGLQYYTVSRNCPNQGGYIYIILKNISVDISRVTNNNV